MKNFVYVVDGVHCVKVGMTSQAKARLKTLQGHSPIMLSMPYLSPPLTKEQAAIIEHNAHSRLDDWHSHNEWFTCTVDEAIQVIKGLLSESGFAYNVQPAKPVEDERFAGIFKRFKEIQKQG